MSAPLIRSELHQSESDSPPSAKPMSTNSNKGGSLLSPPKAHHYFGAIEGCTEGDATISYSPINFYYSKGLQVTFTW